MSNTNCCVGCKIGFKDNFLAGHICKKNSISFTIKADFSMIMKDPIELLHNFDH